MTKSKLIILFAYLLVSALLIWIRITPRFSTADPDATAGVKYESGTYQVQGKTEQHSPAAKKSLPSGKPRGPYIVIDRYCNRLYLRTTDRIILEAQCSTGSGAELIDTISGQHWKFDTPPGTFAVNAKLLEPWWRKPDWVYVEEGSPIPTHETDRYDNEMLGDYAIGFGDGYFIHGTIYQRMLGKAVTHGCVRLGAGDLKLLYDNTQVGTRVYVF